MPFRDLREYVDALEKEGELLRVAEEVDWNLEVGAIIRRVTETEAPAALFQNIKDYPGGFRILGSPAGPSGQPGRYYARMAISMDMNPDSSAVDIMEEYIRRKDNLISPVLVSDGPCKENIHKGDEVDLLKFPVPLIHGGDGGRYIGTWHIVVTKDPDTGWVNWGMYRMMVHDRNTIGGIIAPSQHIGMMHRKYETRGQPMEFAVALGTEPVTPLIGAGFCPPGINEADLVGAIRREPIELVKCETVDLEVPATSEIVLEGVVLPNERKEEGPFGEYSGYQASERSPKPVYHVKAVTHRNNPILPVTCMGVPVDDGQAAALLLLGAGILDELRMKNLPVRMVYCPPETVSHTAFISTKVPYPGFAKKLAHTVWSTQQGNFIYQIVVVDDDVDVTNINEVLHAFAAKCHPGKGIYIVPDAPAQPHLVPFLDPEDRLVGRGAYVVFDCTWPTHWKKEQIPVKSSFDVIYPKEIREKVLNKWSAYGFGDSG